jgi:hypothetical protein
METLVLGRWIAGQRVLLFWTVETCMEPRLAIIAGRGGLRDRSRPPATAVNAAKPTLGLVGPMRSRRTRGRPFVVCGHSWMHYFYYHAVSVAERCRLQQTSSATTVAVGSLLPSEPMANEPGRWKLSLQGFVTNGKARGKAVALLHV